MTHRSPSSPRISVIIPTYNRAGYIRQAIDSVLQQSVDAVEVIVADDGSTDETRAVVGEYGDRVKYVVTQNGGVAHARNVGMRHATGDYLTFLDSDDVLYPHMLELESRILDRHPEIAMVYAEMSAFDDEGFFDRYHLKTYHQSAYRDPEMTYDRIFESSARLGDLDVLPAAVIAEDPGAVERRAYFGNIFDSYLTSLVVFQNNMMVRRSVVGSVGLRREQVRYWQEVDYILRITRDHRVCFVDVPTYKLRYHAGQISTTAGERGRYVWMRKQQWLLRVVKRHAFQDRAYYLRHRHRIDRHLAHLHRAVAVPLMVGDGSAARRRALARVARKHLRRCRAYGHPQRWLLLLTFAPDAVRRFGVSAIEQLRGLTIRWAARRVQRTA
jgi:glycosyltransferase involved in cell wall biosynthesis